jgi:uncharacterized protein YjbI with pentapeptide repeats
VVWVPVAIVAAAGLLVLLLGPISWWATPAKHLQGKDKADVRNATRQIVLAAVGGMVLLTGAAFTARTFYLTRRGQFTDRYTKAIGQIASDKLTERLGGIYALEHLMVESERDHNTVIEVLAAFVRERTRRPTTPSDGASDIAKLAPATDVQAAVTVLGRRPNRREPNPVDLNNADLRDVDLSGADLAGAHLQHVELQGATLRGANLAGANLHNANLIGANLIGANMSKARLREAILRDAILSGANLDGANLDGADLRGAKMNNTDLTGANLRLADLKGALLNYARTSDSTVLPPGVPSPNQIARSAGRRVV